MVPGATGCNETVGVYHLPPCASLASSYLFECKFEFCIEKGAQRIPRQATLAHFFSSLHNIVYMLYIHVHVKHNI